MAERTDWNAIGEGHTFEAWERSDEDKYKAMRTGHATTHGQTLHDVPRGA